MNDPSTSLPPAPTAPSAPSTVGKPARALRPSRWRAAATLLIVALLVVAVYAWLDSRRQIAEQRARAAAVAQQVRDAEARLQSANARNDQLAREIGELKAAQLAMPAAAGEVAPSGDAAILLEVERLITLATHDLQLTRQTETAEAALQLADARVATANRPQWQGLRRAIARDLERLRQVPDLDIAAIALRIDAMIAGSSAWPLASTAAPAPVDAGRAARNKPEPPSRAPAAAKGEAKQAAKLEAKGEAKAAAAQPPVEASRWDRVRAWLASEFGDLVRINEVSTPEALLLTDPQGLLVRQQFKLRLLSARNALLVREAKLFKSDIEQAQTLLAMYFDSRVPAVSAAAAQLRQLATLPMPTDMPAVGESARVVAALRAGLTR